jgi:serine/threonine-protein kinase
MTDHPLLGNRYQFVKTLGSEPDGSTYLVIDTLPDDHPKCVVRKLPLLGKSSKVTRFVLVLLEKKAEALKKVSTHDQIPEILAYFEENDFFYLVEEFIPGRSLSDALKPDQTFPETTVQHLIREILKILQIVHGWGIIHRCIKPSNLIQRYPDNRLVLTGFGIFKEISTQNGKRSGNHLSPKYQNGASIYIPIDQLEGQHQFSNDIYAVGIIGIQALTGLPPQELRQIRHVGKTNEGDVLESFSWHRYTSVSPEFRDILERMISPDPSQRYTTVADVLEELNRLSVSSATFPTSMQSEKTQVQSDPNHQATQSSKKTSKRPLIVATGLLTLIAVGAVFMLGRIPQRVIASYALRQGNALQERGDSEGAIAHYTNALKAFPTADAYTQRGIAYFLADEPLLAQEDLNRAIELGNTNSQAVYYRGNIRYGLGDLQGALEDYTQAIQMNPEESRKARVNRGSVRAELGDDEGAIADYDAGIQQDPNFVAAYVNRCLSRSNVGEHQGAIADCTQAIRLEPNSVDAYQNRALVRRRIGETIGAIQDLNIAINLAPDDPDPYYNRGLARIELGDTAGAIADYTQAITLDPNHTFAYYDRGIARMNANDFEGAIEDLEQSAKLCLDAGRIGCYDDAQFKLSEARRLEQQSESTDNRASRQESSRQNDADVSQPD